MWCHHCNHVNPLQSSFLLGITSLTAHLFRWNSIWMLSGKIWYSSNKIISLSVACSLKLQISHKNWVANSRVKHVLQFSSFSKSHGTVLWNKRLCWYKIPWKIYSWCQIVQFPFHILPLAPEYLLRLCHRNLMISCYKYKKSYILFNIFS